MIRQQYFKALLFLFIIPSFLFSCQSASEIPSNQNTPNSISNISQINEFQIAQTNLTDLLNSFNKQLREVANNQRQKNNIDNKAVFESLKQLQQASTNFRNNLVTSEQKQIAAPHLQEINTIINDIKIVIERLNPGLEKSDVAVVQKYLKLDVNNPNVNNNLGKFGLITQNAIQKYFQEKNNKLLAEINQLLSNSSVINRETELSNIAQTLESKFEELTINNQRLKRDLIIFPTLSFFIGLIIGSILMFIYRERQNTSSRGNNQYREVTQINTTSQQTLVENQNINPVLPPSTQQPQVPSSNITAKSTLNNIIQQPTNHSLIPQTDLIAVYNQNRRSLSNLAIEVSETKDSINQRRLGVKSAVILEQVRRGRGNYWIVSWQEREYLVPKENFKIDEYNYETVHALFDCQNYQAGYSRDFRLIQAAQVATVAQAKWQIIEFGVLQF
ncbi:hypothetical protein NIES4071_60240 [Calothrix sp. NIES-4071]|nr:hypothetical protein NIES4071_60240 [Calothrix sp. NIES-4071]BAZ60331.1 hypothetical protein NIES4105_60190 [Calothrix sp. NIES-4105]